MSKKRNNAKKEIREGVLSWIKGKDGEGLNLPFFLVGVAAILIVLAAAGWSMSWFGGDESVEVVEEIVTEYDGPRHALTGEPVEEEVRPGVFAVMVENSTDARPQSGIDEAFLVYEAPVEGDITRWLALFSADTEVDEIGPVRSARPYYVRLATGWDALYAHVGGSPESLELIDDRGVYDLNEFFWGYLFWRSRWRSAPHNVYTESERLQEGWDEVIDDEVVYGGRLFKDDMTEGKVAEHVVTIPYNNSYYNVDWEYQPETNDYSRYQEGRVAKTKKGDEIVANNIAVLKTSIAVIDEVGRKDIDVIGSGEAIVFIDGATIEGTWKKNSMGEIERFFDASGNEIEWNAGVTWVQVIDEDNEVIVTSFDGSEASY